MYRDLIDIIEEQEKRQEIEIDDNEILSDEFSDINDFDLIHESFDENIN